MFVAALAMPMAAVAQSAFDDPGARSAAGGGGDLSPVNDKVEAGGIAMGSSSQVVVLVKNNDSKPIKTGAINLYPSSNISATVGENQCSAAAIEPGEVCAISVQVKGLQQGRFRIEMLMRHEGRTKLLTAAINGDVERAGDGQIDLISDVELIPASIDFGSLTESRAQSKTVILRNKTSKDIDIEDVVIEAGLQSGFDLSTNCTTLQTGSACVATVNWLPEKKGPSSGTLIVKHSGSTGVSTGEIKGDYSPQASVPAEAFPEAVPGKGLLISSKETIDFGGGITQSSSITVSLVNVGDVPLTVTKIFMTNAENGVRTESTGCRAGTILAPLEACPLTLTWEPVREGSIVDDVQVAHSGARGLLVLPLRGSASKAINKDRKAITLSRAPGVEAIISQIQPLSMDEVDGDHNVVAAGKSVPRAPEGNAAAVNAAAKDGATSIVQSGDRAVPGRISQSPAGKQTASFQNASFTQDHDLGITDADVRGMLDGYTITSYSQKRAIVTGPGGSRVVFNGERTVIGGILWEITMRQNAVEFKNGSQKVLLLFDQSLSSFNLDASESQGGDNSASSPQSSSTTPTP